MEVKMYIQKSPVNSGRLHTFQVLKVCNILTLCCLLIGSFFSTESLCGQSTSLMTGEIQASLKKPGVPEGLVFTESYRSISHSFYSLPEGIKLADLNDMEKVGLASFKTDERFIITEDADGKRVVIKEVLDPSSQFVPQALPYSTMIMKDGYVSFLGEKGNLIMKTFVGEEEVEELPNGWDGEPDGAYRSGGKDIPETGDGDITYREEGYEVVVNQSKGMIATTFFDLKGEWEEKHLEFYDLNDEDRGIPLYEISVKRTTTSYDNCVFHVVMTSYPEYLRVTPGKEGKEQVDPRSAAETEIYSQLEAAKIWPNPATSTAFIELPNIPDVREVNITVIGLDGKEVYQQVYPTNSTHSIQLSGIAPGIYIARLQAAGVTRIEKLIIQ